MKMKIRSYLLDFELMERFNKSCKENCLTKSRVLELLVSRFLEKDSKVEEFKNCEFKKK